MNFFKLFVIDARHITLAYIFQKRKQIKLSWWWKKFFALILVTKWMKDVCECPGSLHNPSPEVGNLPEFLYLTKIPTEDLMGKELLLSFLSCVGSPKWWENG